MAEPPRRRPPGPDLPTKPPDEGLTAGWKFAPPDDPGLKTSIMTAPVAREAAVTLQREAVAPPRQAAGGSAMPAPVAAVAVDPPTDEHPRAKVWVATHQVSADPDPRLVLLRDPDSERAAAFRVLRHRLEERGSPRVIAVSSAERGEGKTTCAVNLALALGECGRARVLLVEANLRTPSLAALFGFLPPECFAAQLERHRERPLDPWSVVEVASPTLHVAAVKPDGDRGERPLLDGIALGAAMHELRRADYDYLVIDTPSVLGSADVNLIEDHVDGVLLTAWSTRSSSRALRRAVEQLSPGKILGLTLLDA